VQAAIGGKAFLRESLLFALVANAFAELKPKVLSSQNATFV
jgi:hypothetical protein